MKADTSREILISCLFSTCVVGLFSQFVFIDKQLSLSDHLKQGAELRYPYEDEDVKDSKEEYDDDDDDDDDDDEHGSFGPYAQRWLSLAPEEQPLHVGLIAKNLARPGSRPATFRMQFFKLIYSIFSNTKTPRGIHFTILTDDSSPALLVPILRKYVKTHARTNVTFDFFDASIIADRFREDILKLSPFFTSTSKQAKKYRDELFMLAPFYHRVFPFDKFIMLDLDLKFKVGLEELYQRFDDFDEREVMGVARDLSPHYRHVLRHYRESHPNTDSGAVGKKQGFNTGVVLFYLGRMRSSVLYNNLIGNVNNSVISLAQKYSFRSHLGDQCLFTLLGQEHPELFHQLGCQYNFQLDVSLGTQKEFANIFPEYHKCTKKPKIFHGNGGAPIPLNEEDEILYFGKEYWESLQES